MLFSELFDKLDYWLSQQSEDGDSPSDYFRKLPTAQAKDVVSDTIEELIDRNSNLAWTEDVYHFGSHTNVWEIPDNYARLLEVYDESTSKWSILPDSSDQTATIFVSGENEVTNTNGWDSGDDLRVRVVKYPSRIDNETDSIDYRFSHGLGLRVLILEIMMKVYGRINKAVNNALQQEYQIKLQMWINQTGRIKTKRYAAKKGFAFGRRTR